MSRADRRNIARLRRKLETNMRVLAVTVVCPEHGLALTGPLGIAWQDDGRPRLSATSCCDASGSRITAFVQASMPKAAP